MEIRCSFGLNRFVYVNRIKCAYMRENVYLNAFVSITSEVIQYFKDPLMMLRLLDKECPSRTTKIPNLITITSATSNHHPFLSLSMQGVNRAIFLTSTYVRTHSCTVFRGFRFICQSPTTAYNFERTAAMTPNKTQGYEVYSLCVSTLEWQGQEWHESSWRKNRSGSCGW